jgi:hypothetical protein
MRGGGASELI